MSSEPRQRYRTPLSKLPIRLRLATSVAAVAFVILAGIAVAVGMLTAHRLRSDFNSQVTTQAQNFAAELRPVYYRNGELRGYNTATTYAPVSGAVARILSESGNFIAETPNAPYLGSPFAGTDQVDGYRVVTIPFNFGPGNADTILVQYGLPVASLASEIGNLRLFLLLGAFAGTALAFVAGSFVARRAIAPIAELTAAAGEIERTGDTDLRLPEPTADDEVAELTRTLSAMLASLSAAREVTQATLERQRAFVADASHELRTPLTSVLANLELLAETLDGPDRDAALSALRSTHRMRRLVGDLLLLARADAGHQTAREPLDLADVVVEAAGELEPASHDHTLDLDVQPAPVMGNRDDLQRIATNLIENALRHTPPGSHVTVSTRSLADSAELVVADDGPGIAEDLRGELFGRFVRGAGDRGGSFGLGLAIVAAVVKAHDGEVTVDESPHGGARFTVRLPSGSGVQAPDPNSTVPATTT